MAIQIEAYEAASKSGWLPTLAAVPGDESSIVTRGNKYLRLTGYIGGIGEVPTENVGDYLGPDGYVDVQAQATDITRYSGEELAQYLRDVGFTIELPIVTALDNNSVLVAENGQWVKKEDLRGALRKTRRLVDGDGETDTMLLPDPENADRHLVPIYIPAQGGDTGYWGYFRLANFPVTGSGIDFNGFNTASWAQFGNTDTIPLSKLPSGVVRFRGDWSDSEDYNPSDTVVYQDLIYVARQRLGAGDGVPQGSGGWSRLGGVYRGEWLLQTDYYPQDVVLRNGSLFVAREANNNNIPGEPLSAWDMIDAPPSSTINGYTIEVVDSLPSNPDENTLYFLRGS